MPKKTKSPKVLCDLCGKPIPKARLNILPDTMSCVECSATRPYSKTEVLGTQIVEEKK